MMDLRERVLAAAQRGVTHVRIQPSDGIPVNLRAVEWSVIDDTSACFMPVDSGPRVPGIDWTMTARIVRDIEGERWVDVASIDWS